MPLESAHSFCRGGYRDDRRRRLLSDELSSADDGPADQVAEDDSRSPQKAEHYGDAAFLARQWRLLDLVPRRWIALGGLLVVGAAAIGALEAAYARMLASLPADAAPVAALRIDARGSLACWLSSLLLLASSVAALLVYGVRRHRTDDYRGRYRVWFWAAICCFLMASDQAASLREAFADGMTYVTGTSLVGDGALWWIAIYVFVWIAVGSRLVADMRPNRLSTTALLAAATAQGLALADRLGWIFVEPSRGEVMFRAGSEMSGNLLLFWAMLVQARYVLMDAERCAAGVSPTRSYGAGVSPAAATPSVSPSVSSASLDEDRPPARPPAAGEPAAARRPRPPPCQAPIAS